VAGSRLYTALRGDAGLTGLLTAIDTQVPDDTTITVLTREVFLPWELLYPVGLPVNPVDGKAPDIDPTRFWGTRFAIETVSQGTGSVARVREAQLAAAPAVSVNVHPRLTTDPALHTSLEALTTEWTGRLRADGCLHGLQRSCTDIRTVLQRGQDRPTLIYVCCHGSSGNAAVGEDETLVLADDCELVPNDVGEDEATPYGNGPVVFLNACQSGVCSPITLSSFLAQFRKRGALGMIATTASIPIAFGVRFGQEVVDAYLARRGSMATALLQLRRRHLLFGTIPNPVPLFYALQCQLDFGQPGAGDAP
jgi:hypothetical protein